MNGADCKYKRRKAWNPTNALFDGGAFCHNRCPERQLKEFPEPEFRTWAALTAKR